MQGYPLCTFTSSGVTELNSCTLGLHFCPIKMQRLIHIKLLSFFFYKDLLGSRPFCLKLKRGIHGGTKCLELYCMTT